MKKEFIFSMLLAASLPAAAAHHGRVFVDKNHNGSFDKGEKVLIPINMRDGSILAVGKGNVEWNNSAPHGAGRIMSRTKAKQSIDLEEYKASMQGIYSTSVNVDTLDEAPMAYKSLADIIDVIRDSVEIIDIMKPVYNFKASDKKFHAL